MTLKDIYDEFRENPLQMLAAAVLIPACIIGISWTFAILGAVLTR